LRSATENGHLSNTSGCILEISKEQTNILNYERKKPPSNRLSQDTKVAFEDDGISDPPRQKSIELRTIKKPPSIKKSFEDDGLSESTRTAHTHTPPPPQQQQQQQQKNELRNGFLSFEDNSPPRQLLRIQAQ